MVSILHLADKWSFQSIKTLAIAKIAPIASSMDKIVIGRQYAVTAWLTNAYQAVCVRPDALTLEEGRRLGIDDIIRINSIRQEFCFVPAVSFTLSEEEAESCFSIVLHAAPAPSRAEQNGKDVNTGGAPTLEINDMRYVSSASIASTLESIDQNNNLATDSFVTPETNGISSADSIVATEPKVVGDLLITKPNVTRTSEASGTSFNGVANVSTTETNLTGGFSRTAIGGNVEAMEG